MYVAHGFLENYVILENKNVLLGNESYYDKILSEHTITHYTVNRHNKR